jgi:hypothetical protein
MTRLPAAGLLAGILAALSGAFTHPARLVAADPPKGLRVFSAGHSFHVPMPDPLDQIAKAAGVSGHRVAGKQGIGGSTVAQHWNVPDDKDKARKALKTGEVDVLTLSPHANIPDDAIDKFVALMLEHNPNGRVTLQASWVPYDGFENQGKGFKNAQRDDADPVALRKSAAPWVTKIRDQAKAINDRHGKTVVLIVPTGEAVVRLRERVVKGEVPGIKKQSELFTDDLGHTRPAVAWLNGYCHFAVIYGRSPVGVPTPDAFKKSAGADADRLNRILQEVAWEAVLAEPMSGVKKSP